MCPIVPTFTCGLLRSNFSFAIMSLAPARSAHPPTIASPCQQTPLPDPYTRLSRRFRPALPSAPDHLSLHPADDLLGHSGRHFFIPRKVHGVAAAALRAGTKVGGVVKHLGQRHDRADNLRSAAQLHSFDPPPP